MAFTLGMGVGLYLLFLAPQKVGGAATPLLFNFLHVNFKQMLLFLLKSRPPTMQRACIYTCMHMR